MAILRVDSDRQVPINGIGFEQFLKAGRRAPQFLAGMLRQGIAQFVRQFFKIEIKLDGTCCLRRLLRWLFLAAPDLIPSRTIVLVAHTGEIPVMDFFGTTDGIPR